jgi:hypothetical protein
MFTNSAPAVKPQLPFALKIPCDTNILVLLKIEHIISPSELFVVKRDHTLDSYYSVLCKLRGIMDDWRICVSQTICSHCVSRLKATTTLSVAFKSFITSMLVYYPHTNMSAMAINFARSIIAWTASINDMQLFPFVLTKRKYVEVTKPTAPTDLTTEGVEPNPGPPKVVPNIAMAKKYGPLTEKATLRFERRKAARKTKRKNKSKVSIVTRISSKLNTNRKSRARKSHQNNKGISLPEDAYLDCLNDPFNHAAVPLGLGTMVPTETCEAYRRNNITAASDGSFAIVLNPSSCRFVTSAVSSVWGAFVSTDTTTLGTTPTWTGVYPPQNVVSLVNDFDKVRVVSAGLRVFPVTAATATPGFIYAGLVLPTNQQDVTATYSTVPGGTGFIDGNSTVNPTKTVMSLYPSLEYSVGNQPIQVNWRPCQLSDFTFSGDTEPNATVSLPVIDNQVPVLMVIGTGFPAGSSIGWDAICHLEGYNSQKSSSSENTGYDERPTIITRYPSVEALWNRTSKYLQPIVDYSAESIMTNLTEKLSSYGNNARIGFNNSGMRAIRAPYLVVKKLASIKEESKCDSDFDSPIHKEPLITSQPAIRKSHPLTMSTLTSLLASANIATTST